MKVLISSIFCLGSVLVLGSPTVSYAEEQYRAEISGTYQRQDFDSTEGRGLDTAAGLELFLAPVHTGNHPYAEAAFLEKIGSIGFSCRWRDVKSGISDSDDRTYDLFLNYTTPDFPIVVRAEWSRERADFQASSDFFADTIESESTVYKIALGTYLSYGLFASVGYGEHRGTSTVTTTSFLTTTTSSNSDKVKQYSLNAKYVKELGSGTAVNLEAKAVQEKIEELEAQYYSFSGDFYFTRSLSAGAGVLLNNSFINDADGKIYSVRAQAFVTPSLSLKAGYDRLLPDNDGMDGSRDYSVTLALRF